MPNDPSARRTNGDDAAIAKHDVVIAGAGPAGLMLAAELKLAGVDVSVVERRTSQELVGSRAGGLHARTIEELDQRGVAERFLAEGQRHSVAHFHVPLDLTDCPTRHHYVLGLWQNHIERILAGWVDELGVPIRRGSEVAGFVQHDDGVDVEVADGSRLRAQYLVGCDGGRSAIRKAAGIELAGWAATTSWLIAEVAFAEEPAWGFRQDAAGSHGIGKLEDGRRARIVLTEAHVHTGDEPTFRDVSEALVGIYGTDYGIHSPTWISRFTDAARQAVRYRERRVLLAGDAAHVHAPVGGQGLNIGVQDAVNLGWKLAQVVKGISPESLLDTYHAERHPVAARVLRNTLAQVALRRTDELTKALGEYVSKMLSMDEPRRRWAAEMAGLDVHYALGDGHPLLGRRMPDLDLVTSKDGPRRVFEYLHEAKPVLLNLDERARFDVAPSAHRVRRVDAAYAGAWELPAIGVVSAPRTVLIRPDGYVAWVGEGTDAGLAAALTRWFGRAAH